MSMVRLEIFISTSPLPQNWAPAGVYTVNTEYGSYLKVAINQKAFIAWLQALTPDERGCIQLGVMERKQPGTRGQTHAVREIFHTAAIKRSYSNFNAAPKAYAPKDVSEEIDDRPW